MTAGSSRPGRGTRVPDDLARRDFDSLNAVTGWVTCRVEAEHALLHCRRCDTHAQVVSTPRPEFLAAVRDFVSVHESCA